MPWSSYWTESIVIAALFIAAVIFWLIIRKTKTLLRPRSGHRSSFSSLTRKEKCFDIGFDRLGLVLPNGTQVLDGVSGSVRSGRTTAVMGPSGSGKTTFLTTLAGRATYGTSVGRIEINGVEDSLLKYPKLVGFVPQEDIMHRDLTVEENLLFSAHTRLSSDLSFSQQRAVVDEVIDLLGLTELRDSVIGNEEVRGISGGQRKRVNIGIELCADPTVLFLDEPTSGLDSSSSKEICGCLQRLAASTGITIVSVIHSPRYEIFEMFDDILLLGKGGSTVYLGPSKSALKYFSSLGFQCGEHVNPADFMLDVIAGEIPRAGHPDFQPQDLFFLWEQRRAEFSPSATTLPPIVSVQQDGEVSVQMESTPLLVQRRDSDAGMDVMEQGTWLQGICCVLIFFLFPPFVFIPMLYYPRTRSALRGAVFGSSCMTLFTFASLLAVMLPVNLHQTSSVPISSGEFWMAPMVAMVCLCWAIPVFIVTVYHLIFGKDVRLVAQFISGAMLSVFYLPIIWFKKGITPKERYASNMGFASCLVVCCVIFMFGVIGCIHPVHQHLCHLGPSLYIICWMLSIGGTIFVVNLTRYRLVASSDRQTANPYVQGFFVFYRAMTQQLRYPLGFLFDVFLPVLSAVFLGLIFYGRTYTGPIINELFPDDKNATCPPTNMTVNPKFQNLCPFLLIPADDPFLPAASLTSMAVGLAAVASSIRVFAAETVIFKREHRAKLGTEAYYIGKSLAHLVTIALASLCFTVSFHSFVTPLGVPFWKVYLFYFAVYFTCSGIAYLVSFLVPAHLAQLAGILVILVFMMFSGGNPTLSQLKQNKLLPFVMVLPSYVSLFRWTNELYYLMMVEHYHPLASTLALYGYSTANLATCVWMIVLLAFSFRLFAYVAVVRQEV